MILLRKYFMLIATLFMLFTNTVVFAVGSTIPDVTVSTPSHPNEYVLYTSGVFDVDASDNGPSCLPIPSGTVCGPGFIMKVVPIIVGSDWLGSDCAVSDLYANLSLNNPACPAGVWADASDYTTHGCDNRGIKFQYQLVCGH